MPEGHSLVLAARRLQPIVGSRVVGGLLEGATIAGVETRGKHLLVHTADGRTVHVHLGMSGRVRLAAPGAGGGRHVIRTERGDAVFARAPRVEVARTRTLRLQLGPDLLGGFDPHEYLRRARLVDRPAGEMLIDQRVLAGVGNIAKSEALWECRIDPFVPVSALTDQALVQLAETAAGVLRDGIERHGRLQHRVYQRAGRPCPRCATPIRSLSQGEQRRRTYWCPECQG